MVNFQAIDFNDSGKEEWKKQVEKELKGQSLEKLNWLDSSFGAIEPIYDYQEYLNEKAKNPTFFSSLAGKKRLNAYSLIIHDEKLDNQNILTALNLGAEFLLLDCTNKSSINYDDLLNEVKPEFIEIVLLVSDLNNNLPQHEQIKIFKKGDGFIDSLILKNQGISIQDEIFYLLSKGYKKLNELKNQGEDLQSIGSKISFRLGVSANYFLEIAKIRSFRKLWNALLNKEGAAPDSSLIISESAVRYYSTTDLHNNILRSTLMAMSSLLGSVDAVSLSSFDYWRNKKDPGALRWALNINTLLKYESYIDKNADPVAGTWVLDIITFKISQKVWEQFKSVNHDIIWTDTGFLQGFNQRIEQNAQLELSQLNTRKKWMVGVNNYPNNKDFPNPLVNDFVPLSWHFEKYKCLFKEQVLSRKGKNKIALIQSGDLNMSIARAGFIRNLFGIAGFDFIDLGHMNQLNEEIIEKNFSESDIWAFCGSDQDYLTMIKNCKNALDKKYIIIAGKTDELKEQLKNEPVNLMLNAKDEIISVLEGLLKDLNNNE